MSAVIRDTLSRPRIAAGRWDWPDPSVTTPPPMAATRERRPEQPIAARWPIEPSMGVWPPAPPPPSAPPPPPSPGPSRPEIGVTPASPPAQPHPLAPDLDHLSTDPFKVRTARRDPAPSVMSYRLTRLWLTPLVRHLVRVGLPMLLVVVVAVAWFAQADNRAALSGVVTGVIDRVQTQPMFMVTDVQIIAQSAEVAQAVAERLAVTVPVSSFDLDLPALRAAAEEFDAVASAGVLVRPGGVLEIRVTEREPAMIWRHEGGLVLIDATGHPIAQIASRAVRPDLPLIAGLGADQAVSEARLLLAAALPLRARVRGLVRIGERRWDLLLDRDQRILLPAEGALGALERVLALNAAQDLLARDVRLVDLRTPARPVLRLSADAMADLTRNRSTSTGAPIQ